jgi:hypothetical protein
MPSARVMITIPAELAKRLEKFRGRVNLSQIATVAIERKVRELEGATRDAEEIADLLARLREENEAERTEVYSLTFAEAQRLARSASRATLQLYYEIANSTIFQARPSEYWEELPARAGEKTRDVVSLMEQASDYDRLRTDDDFVRAFVEGVASFWDAIKDKL